MKMNVFLQVKKTQIFICKKREQHLACGLLSALFRVKHIVYLLGLKPASNFLNLNLVVSQRVT